MTTTKGPTQAEKVADAVLRAAGSGFRHYMPSTKTRIIEAAEKALAGHAMPGDGWRSDMENAPKDGTEIDVWGHVFGNDDFRRWANVSWRKANSTDEAAIPERSRVLAA
jgi:hypothetical protein